MGINLNNRDIYIVFSRTGTMFSNVIALFTQKEYSHVSLSLDASFNQMFSFGRKIPSRVLPAGLVKENLYDGVFAMYPKSRCLVYKINISDEQFLFLQNEIDNFFKNKDDYKYSILGTITAYLNKPHKREYYYFCSQFVSELLINSGIYKTDKLPEVIKPMDLLEIENKIFIYEGLINKDNYANNSLNLFRFEGISKRISKFISW